MYFVGGLVIPISLCHLPCVGEGMDGSIIVKKQTEGMELIELIQETDESNGVN